MLFRSDEHVVDIEHQPAARLPGHLGNELPLGHFRVAELHVGRNVFECDRPFEGFLNVLDAGDDMGQRLAGIGKRQQVVQVDPVYAGPAQVVGYEGRFGPVGERLEISQIIGVERGCRCDRQRNSVQDDGIFCPDASSMTSGCPPGTM